MSIPPSARAYFYICKNCDEKFTIPDSVGSRMSKGSTSIEVQCTREYCNNWADWVYCLHIVIQEKKN